MEQWKDAAFQHSKTPFVVRQLPVPSLAIMLNGAFKTRLFSPHAKNWIF
jgi:hypothetical protein